ncbi:efflux RND transporter periplasmic adaptor subunit [Achromobacter sp. 2789STDY5608621]|uniref:efflux RND transporter periplasmic adaptor subunit n=1 Tax=Achromobacter sp. 2789STDY5608621 TaxID=1806496 RepID=UPI0006C4D5DB|nr:HlyD family efflux transporter periplasmic adaptor subunit [Achromobacter sp. 2789STDY5608621]CUJ76273.1 putative efflux pump membrane fusion protein [Achromobacter sp. 2789STDY5608621]
MTKSLVYKPGLLAAGVALLVAVAIAFTWQRPPGGRAQEEPSPWIRVSPRPVDIRLGVVGKIVSAQIVTITAPFDGNIKSLDVSEGQRVAAGQRLLEMDMTQLDIQRRQALSEQIQARKALNDIDHWESGPDVARARQAVLSARLSVNDTHRKLVETRQLYEHGIVPRMELDALIQQDRMQALSLASAEAELANTRERGKGEARQLAEMELANASARGNALADAASGGVMAPFPGVVIRAPGNADSRPGAAADPLQAGAKVAQGQGLLAIGDVGRVNVVAKVDETDLNQLRPGQPVEIRGEGFRGLALSGELESIGVQGLEGDSQAGTMYQVVIALPALTAAQQAVVRLGMTANASIVTFHDDQAMVVPTSAIRSDAGKSLVQFRESAGAAEQQIAVSVGPATPDGVVVTGLAPGFVRDAWRHEP